MGLRGVEEEGKSCLLRCSSQDEECPSHALGMVSEESLRCSSQDEASQEDIPLDLLTHAVVPLAY